MFVLYLMYGLRSNEQEETSTLSHGKTWNVKLRSQAQKSACVRMLKQKFKKGKWNSRDRQHRNGYSGAAGWREGTQAASAW